MSLTLIGGMFSLDTPAIVEKSWPDKSVIFSRMVSSGSKEQKSPSIDGREPMFDQRTIDVLFVNGNCKQLHYHNRLRLVETFIPI